MRRSLRRPSDYLPERGKELASEFLRGGIDQPLAKLRQLATDLRIDFIMEDRDLSTFGFETYGRAPLGKAGHATGALARDAVAIGRIEIGQRYLAAECRLHRSDPEDDGRGHLGRRGHFQTLASRNALLEHGGIVERGPHFFFRCGNMLAIVHLHGGFPGYCCGMRCPRRRSTVISARIDIAISSGVMAPRSRPAGALTRSSASGATPVEASLLRSTAILRRLPTKAWYSASIDTAACNAASSPLPCVDTTTKRRVWL